jgi:hypothetical protein
MRNGESSERKVSLYINQTHCRELKGNKNEAVKAPERREIFKGLMGGWVSFGKRISFSALMLNEFRFSA